jgi:FkbM family methyltransferase
MNSYSQYNIDLYLYDLFKNKQPGVFIEAGAHNGIDQSNTYLLEKELNWTGLLVEPNANTFAKCRENRKCFVENYALVAADFNSDSIVGSFAETSFEGTMMGGCTDVHKKDSTANATQLSKLLQKYNISEVNFFSLDVEGYEMEVLKGLDFAKCSPDYILYENHEFLGIVYDVHHADFFKEKNYSVVHKFSEWHFLYKHESVL